MRACPDILVLDSLEFFVESATWSSDATTPARWVPCVLISMWDDSESFLTAVRLGARGYVLQDASASDVVSAIRMVGEGQVVCPPQYLRLLFDFVIRNAEELPSGPKHATSSLTRREQQLIPLIGHGFTNKEIANQLNLSEQTVKNHVHRIMRKVGVADRLSVFQACGIDTRGPSARNVEHPR